MSVAQAFSSLLIWPFSFISVCPEPIVGGFLLSASYSIVLLFECENMSGNSRPAKGRKVAKAAHVIPEANSAIEKHADIQLS